MSRLKTTENPWILGAFLGVTGLLAALLLAWVSQLTSGPIAAAKLAGESRDLLQVLPACDNHPATAKTVFSSPAGRPIEFYAAKQGGKVIALAAKGVNPAGYGGPLQAIVGLDADGRIRAVLITEQHETPGLGSEVCARKFPRTIFNLTQPKPAGLAPNAVLDQFTGLNADNSAAFALRRDGGVIDGRTGATITSRAVAQLVSEIAGTFAAHRAELLNPRED